MANEHGNTIPPYLRNFYLVFEHFLSTGVDMSWLADYDLDMIDAVEALFTDQSYKTYHGKETSTYQTEEDALIQAHALGRSIANLTSACRRGANEEEPLLLLLQFTANLAYERGVRDAHEGRLTSECMQRISAKIAEADKRHDEMREFLDDIRE